MKGKILVIDDEKNIQKALKGILTDEGYSVASASSGEEGLQMVEAENFEAVLLDIWLPGIDGLQVLRGIKKSFPEVPVIMISGHGTISTAVEAVKEGAFDFFEKPLSMERVIITVDRAIYQKRLLRENEELKRKVQLKPVLVGTSDAILDVKTKIDSAAPTDAAVLISGENGTGKEVAARMVHDRSKRKNGPFIAVNCAAVPEGLIESELFGHERGAFTGAVKKKVGKIEMANGGTLFLDEIGDMSPSMQAKLLRFLEEKEIDRVGSNRRIPVDVRIICATNKDLQREISDNRFREDLYFRINVIPMHIPPLRQRKEDISPLVDHFLKITASEQGRAGKRITDEAVERLMVYDWPGNVRELRNFVERLLIMAAGDKIDEHDVGDALGFSSVHLSSDHDGYPDLYREAISLFERDFILMKLRENDMNISKTAVKIGLDRSSIHRKLKSLGIDLNRVNESHRE
ncbi:MAG: response regulator [Deltaproteobacteria bacterium]|nr:response regulator [Deltaproteobacteria bacterium]NIS76480.1 response regulator [Deltaproteobacteria bacterium]